MREYRALLGWEIDWNTLNDFFKRVEEWQARDSKHTGARPGRILYRET